MKEDSPQNDAQRQTLDDYTISTDQLLKRQFRLSFSQMSKYVKTMQCYTTIAVTFVPFKVTHTHTHIERENRECHSFRLHDFITYFTIPSYLLSLPLSYVYMLRNFFLLAKFILLHRYDDKFYALYFPVAMHPRRMYASQQKA